MALVTTVPKMGEQSKAYHIPDEDLAKYEAVETKQTQYEEKVAEAEGAEELGGAGALELDKVEVQAYSHICWCYFRWRGRWWRRLQYCWQSCP